MSQHEDNMEVDAVEEPHTTSKRKTEADHRNIGSTPGGVVTESASRFTRLTKKAATRRPTVSVVGSAQSTLGIAGLAYAEAHKKGLLLGPKDKEEEGRMFMKFDPAHPESTKEHDNMLIDFLPLEEVFGEDVTAARIVEAAARQNQTRRAQTQSICNTVSRIGARNDGQGIAIGALGFPASCSDVITASPMGQRVLAMKASEAQRHAARFDGLPEAEDLTVGQLLHAALFATTASQFKTISNRLIEVSGETRKRERGDDDDEEDHPAEKKAAVGDGDRPKAVDKKAPAAAPKKPAAAPKKAASKKSAPVEEEEEEEEVPVPKKATAKKAAAAPADDEEETPAPKKPAPKKPVAAPVEDEDEEAPAPKKPAPKKPAAAPKKPAAAPKKPVAPADDDEEEEVPAPKPAPKKPVASADW